MICPHESLTAAPGPKYCNACGLFCPTSQAKVLRESQFVGRLDIEPNESFNVLLSSQSTSYNPASSHLQSRRVIVDWMCEVGEMLRVLPITIASAVMLFDSALARKDYSRGSYQGVALVALLVASKNEELDDNVPRLPRLARFSSHSAFSLRKMELDFLTTLNWKLTVVTPLHFIGHFLALGVVFETDVVEDKPVTDRVTRYVRKYADFFTDLVLQEYEFQRFDSLALARACLASARKAVKISPLWTPELTELTAGDLDEVCFSEVFAFYQSTFGARKPLSGNSGPSPKSGEKLREPQDKENLRSGERAHTLC